MKDSSVKRSVDPTGDDIFTQELEVVPNVGKKVQAVVLMKKDETIVGDLNPLPVEDVGAATEAKQDSILTELTQKTEPADVQLSELTAVLRSILLAIANPSYVDKSANQMRAQVVVSSGTVTTVGTVTTITNLPVIDSYQGRLLMLGANLNAWANVQRRTIT